MILFIFRRKTRDVDYTQSGSDRSIRYGRRSVTRHLAPSVPYCRRPDGAALVLFRFLVAQTDGLVGGAFKEAAKAKVTVQNLRRNISVLLGAGGNIAVLTGPDGKLLVDAEIVTARPNVSKALASINADPIKQLINTHWHFDHTGGNEWVHEAGASILAHENTRKHLSKATRVEGNWQHTFPPRRQVRFPPPSSKTNTLCTSTTPLSCSSTTRLLTRTPISPCIFLRPTFFIPETPFGTAITPLSTTRQEAASTANTRRRSEHRKSDRQDDRHSWARSRGRQSRPDSIPRVLVEIRDKVAALKKQGKPLPEVVAAKPGARYDAEWGKLFQNPSDFVALVYQGV